MQAAGLDKLSVIFQRFTTHKTVCMSIVSEVDDHRLLNTQDILTFCEELAAEQQKTILELMDIRGERNQQPL